MFYKNGLTGNDFDNIEEDVFHLYEDLGLKEYPANPFKVANLLGIELIKYSGLKQEARKVILSKYKEGCSVMKNKREYVIYYNDALPECTVRFTVWYEIAHIQSGHLYENMGGDPLRQQSECNHFAVFAQAAMPFVFQLQPDCPEVLMKVFGLGWTCANYVYDNYLYIKRFPLITRKIVSSKILEQFDFKKDLYV